MVKKWLVRLAVLVLVVAAVLVARRTVFRVEPVPVTVFVVARGVVEETVTNSRAGTVRTRARAALSPAVAGRVAAVPVSEGDAVVRGEVVLRLDDAEYRAQLTYEDRAFDVAVAAAREACARADQAERDLRRAERLASDRVVSVDVLEQSQSAAEVARAACAAARARVHGAEAARAVAAVQLEKTILRAPFDGVVANVSAEVGEWITPAPPAMQIPPVVDLINTGEIYVSAPLDEVDLGRVRVGQTVRVTLDPYPDRAFDGTVHRIAPYVEDLREQSRTFEIEVELADGDFARTLRPGTTADVEVILHVEEDVLRVPSYALLEGGEVLVLRDGELVAMPVETGIRNWEFVHVREGIQPGDRVVVSLDRAEVRAGAAAVAVAETLK